MGCIAYRCVIGSPGAHLTSMPETPTPFAELVTAFLRHVSFSDREGVLRSIVILLLAISAALFAVTALLRGTAKLLEALGSIGISIPSRKTTALERRLRRHFCKVLDSDLLTLARAESWNDHYFAELDVELELEGPYPQTWFDRLLKRRREGTRRLSSLKTALRTAETPPLLVTGEPGSGKSVALRHLAHSLLSRHRYPLADSLPIPLYINLRDFAPPLESTLNAGHVKQFVLDNIRRGDGDTVAFVKQHWDDYVRDGRWIFLFDSFDEIPAVMTAPDASAVVEHYGAAISSFLRGTGHCKALVATRPYRCPRALGSSLVTLLPLSKSRKTTLLTRALETQAQLSLALSYLERPDDRLSHNPMLLSLLCRRIRETNKISDTEFAILRDHIKNLANRESDFITRKHAVAPTTLLEAAAAIAEIMAKDGTLGLSPTIASLIHALEIDWPAEDEFDKLLTALVEVKIGRFDVPGAKRGERRFAFAHRRYQEALVAAKLERNLTPDRVRQLLEDEAQFEYSVALLQTAGPAAIALICSVAQELVAAPDHDSVSLTKPWARGLKYHRWRGSTSAHVLRQILHGCLRRLTDLPPAFRSTIGEFLKRRWDTGDQVDRFHVLELSPLMESAAVGPLIESALNSPEIPLREAGYRAGSFFAPRDDRSARAIRGYLFWELLAADANEERLRVEAWALRMPAALSAQSVVRRAKVFRWLLGPVRFYEAVLALPATLIQICLSRREPPLAPITSRCLSLVRRRDWATLTGVLYVAAVPLAGIGVLSPLLFSKDLGVMSSTEAASMTTAVLLNSTSGSLATAAVVTWLLTMIVVIAEAQYAGWHRRNNVRQCCVAIGFRTLKGVSWLALFAVAVAGVYAASLAALAASGGHEPRVAHALMLTIGVFQAIAIGLGIRSGTRFIRARRQLDVAARQGKDAVFVALECDTAIEAAVVLDVAGRSRATVRSHRLRALGRTLLTSSLPRPKRLGLLSSTAQWLGQVVFMMRPEVKTGPPTFDDRSDVGWLRGAKQRHIDYARRCIAQCSRDYAVDTEPSEAATNEASA